MSGRLYSFAKAYKIGNSISRICAQVLLGDRVVIFQFVDEYGNIFFEFIADKTARMEFLHDADQFFHKFLRDEIKAVYFAEIHIFEFLIADIGKIVLIQPFFDIFARSACSENELFILRPVSIVPTRFSFVRSVFDRILKILFGIVSKGNGRAA